MEQSDTPRTDAAVKYGIVDVGDKWTGTQSLGMNVVDVETSRDLERELATATRERDEARAVIEQHVAEAVAKEREGCAKACEDVATTRWDEYAASYNSAVFDCAAAIRARGTT